MVSDLVSRSIRTSLIATAITFPFLTVYIGSLWALGFAAASLWSTANLWAISMVVREYFGRRRWTRLAFLLGVKFPILYGLGIWGLYQRAVPVFSILIGFHVILLVVVLKAVSHRFLAHEGSSHVCKERGAQISGTKESI
jgi:hypothetical protein